MLRLIEKRGGVPGLRTACPGTSPHSISQSVTDALVGKATRVIQESCKERQHLLRDATVALGIHTKALNDALDRKTPTCLTLRDTYVRAVAAWNAYEEHIAEHHCGFALGREEDG